MSTFYLLNTTQVGTVKYFAGTLIDDSITATSPILAQGGQLWPSADSTVATAATDVANFRKNKGINEDLADKIMLAAAAYSAHLTTAGATGAIGATGATGAGGATGATGASGP